MTANDDQYVPSEAEVREAWRAFTGPNRDHGFDTWIARVRRDAAREALDGFKAWRGTRRCPAISPPDPCNRPAGHAEPHAYNVPEGECNWEEFDWEDSDTYRDTHYPEEPARRDEEKR